MVLLVHLDRLLPQEVQQIKSSKVHADNKSGCGIAD